MLPQMRQIQRLDVEGESSGQSKHRDDWEDEVKGIGTLEREVLGDTGCEDINVWE